VEAKLTMKRAAIGLLILWSAAAVAQAPFTIVRPQDGARVREVVQIRFPIRSVPQGGFIGVSINGKFVEAVAPAALDTDRERGHYIYRWDTKKLNVPDGEHTIELTLYSNPEGGGGARILGRSSVRLQVENEIKVPAEGIFLRYRWTPGKTYRYSIKGVFKEVNEIQYSGLTPEETILSDITFKGDLSVLDFRNNLGLISWTPVPPAIAIEGGQVNVITSDRMAPVYQEVETTGRVRYQISRAADSQQAEVYYYWVEDLPLLPPRRYKPGDRWSATISLNDPLRSGQASEVGKQIPVAARLERFEWEQGYKCAKIVYEFTGNIPFPLDLGGCSWRSLRVWCAVRSTSPTTSGKLSASRPPCSWRGACVRSRSAAGLAVRAALARRRALVAGVASVQTTTAAWQAHRGVDREARRAVG
jgi:hypothetical protein